MAYLRTFGKLKPRKFTFNILLHTQVVLLMS